MHGQVEQHQVIIGILGISPKPKMCKPVNHQVSKEKIRKKWLPLSEDDYSTISNFNGCIFSERLKKGKCSTFKVISPLGLEIKLSKRSVYKTTVNICSLVKGIQCFFLVNLSFSLKFHFCSLHAVPYSQGHKSS